MAVLECRDLKKVYRTDAEEIHALRGVDVAIGQGEFVAIMGASGSGKSTLLHLMGGLDRPSSGMVTLDGTDYGTLSNRDLTLLRRRKIGFVFQSFNLIPTLTAEENIQLPLLLDGRSAEPARLHQLLEELHLTDRAKHRPSQLSGGQQQRVAIGRALITEPTMVLADEPTGNLDSATAHEVLELFRSLCTRLARTVVIVTHDPKVAAFADRIITVQDGRIAEELELQKAGGEAGARTAVARVAQPL